MPASEFPYRREESLGGWVYRPVAAVILKHAHRQLQAMMYIDSGADMTTLPLGVGEALGLSRSSKDRISEMRGVSGVGVPYFTRTVQMNIDGIRFNARVAWTLAEDVPLLLGRLDVFRRFDILFLERRRLVRFHRVRALSDRPRGNSVKSHA